MLPRFMTVFHTIPDIIPYNFTSTPNQHMLLSELYKWRYTNLITNQAVIHKMFNSQKLPQNLRNFGNSKGQPTVMNSWIKQAKITH